VKVSRTVCRQRVELTPQQVRLLVGILRGAEPEPGTRGAFERAFAGWLGVRHAFALESARSTLAVLLRAMDLPPGARVILPAYCFFTLPMIVEALGLTPVFAPMDPRRYAVDPDRLVPLLDGASAMVLIHPFGQTADVVAVERLCRDAGVALLEDPSQSTGAAVHGRKVGSFGHAATFSLISGKNLQAFGGGLLVTEDDALGDRIRQLVEQGREPADEAVRRRLGQGLREWAATTRLGYGAAVFPAFLALSELARGRLDDLFVEPRTPFDVHAPPVWLSDFQGRLGLMELEQVEARNGVRRRNGQRLLAALQGAAGLELPHLDPAAVNTFSALPVRVADGPTFARRLLRRGVDTRMDFMEWFGGHDSPPGQVVFLPNHPGMADRTVDRVARVVRRVARDLR
jgi:dTDP-4-amino-4,6-dideoxygalactose transaminase